MGKNESLLINVLGIIVFGVVAVLVLSELDIVVVDVANIPATLGNSISKGFSAIWNTLFGWIKAPAPSAGD